jgi:hypothetical protein
LLLYPFAVAIYVKRFIGSDWHFAAAVDHVECCPHRGRCWARTNVLSATVHAFHGDLSGRNGDHMAVQNDAVALHRALLKFTRPPRKL